MKKYLLKALSLVFVLASFSAQNVMASVADSSPISYVQPDGSIIEIYKFGDENYNFTGDKDGYLLEKNEDGKYEYVTSDISMFSFSASESGRPANAVKGFDLKETDDNEVTEYIIDDFDIETPIYSVGSFNEPGFFASKEDITSNKGAKETKLLVIAVDFANVKLDPTHHSNQAIYDSFFSSDKNDISVYNYYNEVSRGKQLFVPAFTLGDGETYSADYGKVADGVIKVLLDIDHTNPGGLTGTAESNAIVSIITSAVTEADEYIDFSAYNKDSLIDLFSGKQFLCNDELTICFLVAGYESSTGAEENGVWAHKSNLTDCTFVFDDVRLIPLALLLNDEGEFSYSYGDYIMVGAMHNEDNPMGIGSYCHELAHTLGVPDLYNTVNQSANYSDAYTLSLMEHGNWCAKDTTSVSSTMPSYLGAWERYFLGWYDESEILEINYDEKLTADIFTHLSDNNGYKLIKVNTINPDEYYLIENRAFEGYDTGLKFHKSMKLSLPGIAIWKIDESVLEGDVEDVIIKKGEEIAGYIKQTNVDINRINCTSKPAVMLIRSGKGFLNSEYTQAPLWCNNINKMSFFGSLSYPANTLNTGYNDVTDSGVEIDFLTNYGDKMTMAFGASNTDTAIYAVNGNIDVHAFNDRDEAVSFTPIIANYNVEFLESARIFPKLDAPANSHSKSSVSGTLLPNPRLFTWDMETLKPIVTR